MFKALWKASRLQPKLENYLSNEYISQSSIKIFQSPEIAILMLTYIFHKLARKALKICYI